MNEKSVLITGAAGFIGRNIARELIVQGYRVTGVVRPNTRKENLKDISEQIKLVEIDLVDIQTLKNYLSENWFDYIVHVGALRGGRRFSNKDYYKCNVNATEQIASFALEKQSLLLFCSSVGVFGAIPKELPADINTVFQEDNYYHFTKIKAEQIIQNLIMKGLKAHIVRPAITYGANDYGFPYTLTKLIDKKMLYLPDKDFKIHLANVELLREIFNKLLTAEYEKSHTYIAADKEPVYMSQLVDFISKRLKNKPYPINRKASVELFRKAERTALRLGMLNLVNKVRLISYDWYYDTGNLFDELNLKQSSTIPMFKNVVDWYKSQK